MFYIIEKAGCANNMPYRKTVGYIKDNTLLDIINSNGGTDLRLWMTTNSKKLNDNTLSFCDFFTDKVYSEVYFCCWFTTSITGMNLQEITDLSTIGVKL